MSIDHESHDLPIDHRLVAEAIKEWLDTGYAIAVASNPDAKPAFDQIRFLYLDNYWYTLVPKILDELRRAGKSA